MTQMKGKQKVGGGEENAKRKEPHSLFIWTMHAL